MNKDERSKKMWQEYPPRRVARKKAKAVLTPLEKKILLLSKKNREEKKQTLQKITKKLTNNTVAEFSPWEIRQFKKSAAAAKRKEAADKRLALEKEVVHMRLTREMTYGGIGEVLGISRERVRQILNRIEKREGITLARPEFKREKRASHTKTSCKKCGVEILVRTSHYLGEGRHGCEKHRRGNQVEYPPELQNAPAKDKLKWRYHNDPVFKQKVLNRTIAWAKKARATGHKSYIQHQREAVRRYAKKLWSDPEGVEKLRQIAREAYHRRKNDPVFRRKERERGLKYRMKKAAERGW